MSQGMPLPVALTQTSIGHKPTRLKFLFFWLPIYAFSCPQLTCPKQPLASNHHSARLSLNFFYIIKWRFEVKLAGQHHTAPGFRAAVLLLRMMMLPQ